MCGIAGYIGNENSVPILLNMLKRLEYRGYDSAGIAYIKDSKIHVIKDKGKISEIEEKIKSLEYGFSNIGIAHTRWATHGEPSQLNAHPHFDCTHEISVVHNGIIENYKELKRFLENRGHRFESETDTEVIAHLIEDELKSGKNFEEAFIDSIRKLKGSYAIAVLYSKENGKILAARKESPLIIGVGSNEMFLASDIPALLPYTREIITLDDNEYVILERKKAIIKNLESGKELEKKIDFVEWSIEEAEKSGFKHFMLKEIFDEPNAVKNALREIEKIREIARKISEFDRLYFVACGTAYYAALAGKYILENFGISSEAVLASEFRYSTINVIDKNCALVAVSQSGETADTLTCVKESKKRDAYSVGIINVIGSSIARTVDDVIYTHSGPEIAVASTKAYIGQLTSITLLALEIAKNRGKVNENYIERILSSLHKLPEKMNKILHNHETIVDYAKQLYNKPTFFYIGRRLGYVTALEGALKIKEISYSHAEAYPAGEMKHGPLALIEEGVPVIAVQPNDDLKDKLESNIMEIKSRGGFVLRVSEDGELRVPKIEPILTPLLYIVPLHLFAYYIATFRGLDPDKPRNLAKSVTVE
ncbi:MAG: glutamine--fructose-6-phosphate transaminase (isomerizing) [Candidatus Altiarchaeales archaeon]|nr:MAG: glutamine--fructose-6-phosphate transaminase (isomerizing) [Candidatus Altiarchaeales archaeon]